MNQDNNMSMCSYSHHWILSVVRQKAGWIFIMDPLDDTQSNYKEFINCIQREQHITRMFITNLVITIVTNDDPFRNSGYRFYVAKGGIHNQHCKDEMHVRYRFPIFTYTSL
jgi:hypothetical protein